MKISLKQLTLLNFKGVRSLTIYFNDKETSIFGQNASGKTTIFDAFLWLLFSKDSTDRKTFEIKTLGPDNQPYHRMDHEVTALLNIDGEDIFLKKTYKEKWVKKRGEAEPVFTGHENIFFWNDVPLKEEDYQRKISDLLNESVFKLITNTAYYNSRPWQERRNVLMQIAGEISNSEIFDSIVTPANKGQFTALINALNSKKTVDEFRREIAIKKKKIRETLDLIPARIDEATRSLPDLLDYNDLSTNLYEHLADLQLVEDELLQKTSAQKQKQKLESYNKKVRDLNELRLQVQQMEFAEKNKVQNTRRQHEQVIMDLKRELLNKLDNVSRNVTDLSNINARKNSILTKQNDLRAKWASTNNEKLEFKDGQFCCPTCKREYEASDIEAKKAELTKNFNQNKSSRLADISSDGKNLSAEVSDIDLAIASVKLKDQELQTAIANLKSKIETAEKENLSITGNESLEVVRRLAINIEYTTLKDRIKLQEEEVNAPQEIDHMQNVLLAKKTDLNIKIDALKTQLSSKDQREKTEKRIEELGAQEREMGQELANLEGVEFSIDEFNKAKMDTLERRINGRFQIVKFKLFAEQINGGQVECCDTLINGVPYPDANNAAKIQAGVDIINTLTEHFRVTAPVFIDNRESVVTIPDSHSQIINLIVSAADKKLRVESEEPAFALV